MMLTYILNIGPTVTFPTLRTLSSCPMLGHRELRIGTGTLAFRSKLCPFLLDDERSLSPQRMSRIFTVLTT